jgi:uridine kinase
MVSRASPSKTTTGEFGDVVEQILLAPLAPATDVKVVAIDGGGGSGKTTFAKNLAQLLGSPHIIHTDDFASWDQPIEWGQRFLDQVLLPLSSGQHLRFQRYDWVRRQLGEWVDIDPGELLVIEGVSSMRRAFIPYISFSIWVEASAEVRLARGLERDGAEMLEQWRSWMAAEDRYVAEETPQLSADLVVSGESATT